MATARTIKRREYIKEYQRTHKEQRAKTRKVSDPLRREKKRQWLHKIKNGLHCIQCGETHIGCLDFHHRNPKEKEANINTILYSWTKDRILAEIAKCDIFCANCHRKLHWTEKYGE